MKLVTKAEGGEFASKLALLKHEAGRLGLWLTMHELDRAVVMVGFEIAAHSRGERTLNTQEARYVRERFADSMTP